MLTLLTQTAIAVLNDIADGNRSERMSASDITPEALIALLTKLEDGGLIRRKQIIASGSNPTFIGNSDSTFIGNTALASKTGLLSSYELCRPYNEITLLHILEATEEHLNCNHPTKEEFYNRYGRAAHRLGVVNHLTRLYLAEIKLSEL